jgi:hypothetical protein
MIELRKALLTYLKTIHPRVYFQVAPEEAQYPYIVFDFPNTLFDGEYQENVSVHIDGWDNNPDTTALESLMALINGNGELVNPTGLDKKTLISDTIAARFGLENKIPLRDDDPRIRRRKYIYQARIFGRS